MGQTYHIWSFIYAKKILFPYKNTISQTNGPNFLISGSHLRKKILFSYKIQYLRLMGQTYHIWSFIYAKKILFSYKIQYLRLIGQTSYLVLIYAKKFFSHIKI